MQLVDVGANLTHPAFRDDLPEVLERARHAGVTTIIVTGTTVEESRKALELGFPTTAGVHPHHARDCDDTTIPDAARGEGVRPHRERDALQLLLEDRLARELSREAALKA